MSASGLAIAFLQQHHHIDTAPTHVSLHQPRGRYAISRTVEPAFLEQYAGDLQANVQALGAAWRPGAPGSMPLGLHLAEMPGAVVPLTVDIDLSADAGETGPLYTPETVEAVINEYIGKAQAQLLSPEYIGIWDVLLLEKEPYVSKGRLKHGFHLHFLNLFMSKGDVLHMHTLVECEGVDRHVANNPWLMYGSSKSADHAPYLVTRMYTGFPTQRAADELIPPLAELPALLSLHTSRHEVRMRPPPRATQAFRYGGGISIAPTQRRVQYAGAGAGQAGGEDAPADLEAVLEEAKELLEHISAERATNYSTWTQIGWILYNVTRGSPRGLELFDEFSRRAERGYDAASVRQLWASAQPRHITIRSLVFYARQDSPAYMSRRRSTVEVDEDGVETMHPAVSHRFTHSELALVAYEEFKSEFVCASVSGRVWYHFRNGTWTVSDDGVAFRLQMSKYLISMLDKERDGLERACQAELAAVDPADEMQLTLVKARKAKLEKQLQKNYTLINTNAFRHAVQREASDLFYCEDFSQLLDMNPKLFAFSNGVYDLEGDTFRPGMPEDYMGKCAPLAFDDTLTEESEAVRAAMTFLEQIFPNRAVRQYFLDQYCDIFEGGNMHKNVLFWTGNGDNGKSVMQIMFEKMLGAYAIKLPTTLVTGKRAQSSSANPELVRTGGGVRFVVMQEPDKTEEINTGCLKEMTGNDSFYARGLYRDGGDICPMFKMALVCNDCPRLPHSDAATWRRIRLLPFEARFVDHADPDYNEQLRTRTFQKDKNFAAKLDSLVPAFAWVLLAHRRTRSGDTIYEPPEVTHMTDNYKARNDVYRQYAVECITEKEGARLHLSTLYESFREWFRLSIGNNAPSKLEARDCFIKLLGPPEINGNTWKNRQLFFEDEDQGDGDAMAES